MDTTLDGVWFLFSRVVRLLGLFCLLAGAVLGAGNQPFETFFRQGLLALQRNDLPVAVAHLEKASRLQPGDARVWLALAQTYRKLDRKQAAQQAALRSATLAPDDPIILHGLAIFHAEGGNWAKAAALETRYAGKAPGDREALPRVVSFHLEAGQVKQAIELAKNGLKAENRAELRNLLGKAYEADGQSDQSIRELQEAIRLLPYEEPYYFDLAYVLLLHQNFDVAIQVLEGAKKIFDKSPQVELALGVAYYGQRRFSEAVDSFLRTATLAPELEQPYVFLGRILDHAVDRLGEVTSKFAAFAAANPQSHLGYYLHAKALIAQSGPSGSSEFAEQAEALLRKAIALNGQHWESHFELGLLLERNKEFLRAAESLERSIQLNPKNPTPHYRLARVYDRLGKKKPAEAERALHQKLSAEEKAAMEKHATGLKRLELVVK